MTSEKAKAALVLELRSIAKVLEAEPLTPEATPEPFLQRIRVISTLAADVIAEQIHLN